MVIVASGRWVLIDSVVFTLPVKCSIVLEWEMDMDYSPTSRASRLRYSLEMAG